MFCGKCGAKIADGNLFCTSCGKRIMDAAQTQQSQW
ncbi:MAG: zinc-ribbon domain-containing protein [Ruminococcus sp.]|nr:zinc-ribbon domain-containing protein [Ruminococcus sp.]